MVVLREICNHGVYNTKSTEPRVSRGIVFSDFLVLEFILDEVLKSGKMIAAKFGHNKLDQLPVKLDHPLKQEKSQLLCNGKKSCPRIELTLGRSKDDWIIGEEKLELSHRHIDVFSDTDWFSDSGTVRLILSVMQLGLVGEREFSRRIGHKINAFAPESRQGVEVLIWKIHMDNEKSDRVSSFLVTGLAFLQRLSSFLLEGNGIDDFWLGLEALTGAFAGSEIDS
ncbi:hypothetical protein Tco_1043342 [Tanacetum coccineum]|uniref:Uncharacterized protein n=1 Tax=Tanacetum coccineum TaxID=301880 RepID=A0ABQ5GNT0_9ASTR